MLDAGIQMKGTFAAVSVCINNQGVIIVEPTSIDVEVRLMDYINTN